MGRMQHEKLQKPTTFLRFGIAGHAIVAFLAEGVGEEDQGDHEDGEDDDDDLQVLLEESAELDGAQALLFENRSTISMMVMMMTHILFAEDVDDEGGKGDEGTSN